MAISKKRRGKNSRANGQPQLRPGTWDAQQGYSPIALTPRSSNVGLVVGAGLAIAAVGILIIVFSVGENKRATGINRGPAGPTTAVLDSVESTLPRDSSPVVVVDETETFSITIPGDLEVDVNPSEGKKGGFLVPRITASKKLATYYKDDTTFGMLVVVVGPEIGSEASQVVQFLEPNENLCAERVKDLVQTAYGTSTRVSYSGCGLEQRGSKVVIVAQLTDRPVVVGIRMQTSDPVTTIQSTARSVLESIVVF